MPTTLNTIAVIGAGQMGAGIAQVAAAAGFTALLCDSAPNATKKGIEQISKRLDRAIEKGSLTKIARDEILSRLVALDALSSNAGGGLATADLVIEAIVENTEIKVQLFKELDKLCPKQTIFASNTSSISITKLAAATARPEQFIGMHFMNPVPVMQLVEIIRGLQTSDATYETIADLTKKLGKTGVTARHDYPGFLVNRILIPMLNEACFVLMEGIASAEEIDIAMKLGTNHPMGPLELADFVGLDTCLAICRILHNELGEDKYRPCPLLVKYVEAGWYGKKSGRGFFRYE